MGLVRGCVVANIFVLQLCYYQLLREVLISLCFGATPEEQAGGV